MRRYILGALSLFLLATALFFVWHEERKPFVAAAHQGIEWFMSYEGDYENAGVFWALLDINARYCRDTEFGQFLTQRFEAYPRTGAERSYFALAQGIEEAPQGAEARYDMWLFAALSCKEQPLSEELRAELHNVSEAARYDLTHKYLALAYLSRLGCATEEDGAALKVAALRMKEEEGRELYFTDLSAERAALLMWAGDASLVDTVWLRKIQRAQDSSGGWADGSSKPNPHTSALALWALTQATGVCPL